jgi:hypothetical protein
VFVVGSLNARRIFFARLLRAVTTSIFARSTRTASPGAGMQRQLQSEAHAVPFRGHPPATIPEAHRAAGSCIGPALAHMPDYRYCDCESVEVARRIASSRRNTGMRKSANALKVVLSTFRHRQGPLTSVSGRSNIARPDGFCPVS